MCVYLCLCLRLRACQLSFLLFLPFFFLISRWTANHVVAGAFSGAVASVAGSPFYLVKTQQQAQCAQSAVVGYQVCTLVWPHATHSHTNKQTDRQTDRQADTHTNERTNERTNRQTDRQAARQTARQNERTNARTMERTNERTNKQTTNNK